MKTTCKQSNTRAGTAHRPRGVRAASARRPGVRSSPARYPRGIRAVSARRPGIRSRPARYPLITRAASARHPRGNNPVRRCLRAEALKSNSAPPTSNPALSGTHPYAGFRCIPPDSAAIAGTAVIATTTTTSTGNNIGNVISNTVIIGGNVNRWPCSLSHH
jgi:hypothetical protein